MRQRSFRQRPHSRLVLACIFTCLFLRALPGRAAEAVVTAAESEVRTAPFAVAPVLARVHAGERLPADDQAHDDWRRVRLPDGRYGYLREPDVQVSAIAPPPPPAPVPNAAPSPQTAEAGPKVGESAAPPAKPPTSSKGPTLAGVIFELLPIGTLRLAASNAATSVSATADTMSTVAVAPFIDFPVSPYFTVGLSPQVIFRVKPNAAAGTDSDTELDLRARFTARAPISPNARVLARVSPAFSFISIPSPKDPSTGLTISNPQGFLIDFALGTEVQLLPNLFLVLDLGYQLGFQSATVSNGATTTGEDFQTRYLHLGGGLAVGFD